MRPQSKTRSSRDTNLEVLVKLVQDKAHAIHETVHVRRCTLVVRRALVRREGFLKRLKVSHPLEGKCVGLGIRLVEDHDERKLCLVKDTERCQPRPKRGKRI